MENKDIKTNTTELNDEALENASGGLLIPISDWDPITSMSVNCAVCGKRMVVPYESTNKKHYCDECKANMT